MDCCVKAGGILKFLVFLYLCLFITLTEQENLKKKIIVNHFDWLLLSEIKTLSQKYLRTVKLSIWNSRIL